MTPKTDSLDDFFQRNRAQIDQALANLLPSPEGPKARLNEAMRYCVLNGGKRVRPLLLLATTEALGGDLQQALPACCAVELIHAYSLVHDDLPAMDDDSLRRGKPTCHIAFDEATAILVGDGLQTLAFSALTEPSGASADSMLQMVRELARASGHLGMVGGQAIDIYSEGHTLKLEELERMHLEKTGALIEASIVLGALSSGRADAKTIEGLRRFAQAIGLAFQVRDDIIDVESDTSVLGKTAGKDAERNKPTYTSLLGLEPAKLKARQLYDEALAQLQALGLQNSRLQDLASFMIERTH
ncbi:polyprenyl synthetase family protein [Hahella sp. NBU794]|uniref:polyprenyl synthetase family protein n=1 Tax=Hahella sp. NBU794 TaxID=3422590 RepID=UPI003D6EC37B